MSARYDVVIIGGGIHGVGAAQAAAAAGYRTLILEQTALAHGTSSRSSKLIHGGLRYLETGQWGLVRESLHERAVLLRLAPTLVRLIPFYIPIYADTTRRPWQIRLGLSLYALLGRGAPDARFSVIPRREWDRLDNLRIAGLETVFRYFDAQTDDAALTRAVMRSASSLGAELACPAQFIGAERRHDGYAVRYTNGTRERECTTSAVINAAGPWVNQVLERVTPTPPRLALELVQGTHIVIPGRLWRGIYYAEAPQDRRAIFMMPWRDATLVGTTETSYRGDPEAVQPLPEEISYLLQTARHYFPDRSQKIISAFAGLRVLPEDGEPAFRRRRDVRLLGDEPRPRFISIYGGKLTGYRQTANKALRFLAPQLPKRRPIADTAQLPLVDDDDSNPYVAQGSKGG